MRARTMARPVSLNPEEEAMRLGWLTIVSQGMKQQGNRWFLYPGRFCPLNHDLQGSLLFPCHHLVQFSNSKSSSGNGWLVAWVRFQAYGLLALPRANLSCEEINFLQNAISVCSVHAFVAPFSHFSACHDVRPGSKVWVHQDSAGLWQFEVGAWGFFHNKPCMLEIAGCEEVTRPSANSVDDSCEWCIPWQKSLEPCFRRWRISCNVWSQSINRAKPVIGLFYFF